MSLGLDPMSNINTNFLSDFDFSSNNQYIASSSLDKTIRVWELSRGVCIRVIYGISPQYCIRFHPVNNNFLSAGNANKELTVTSLLLVAKYISVLLFSFVF
jgi:WD40 repeat protein